MPVYQDKLIFEVDEVAAIHQSLKKVVDTGEKAKLITTYGDVNVKQIGEPDTSENQVLSKAFKSIFNNAGFNNGLFTGESVEALTDSLYRDRNEVWGHIQKFLNFYSIAINNWFDFKDYEANIEILPISPYTYNDDIETFKSNATLGVGKLDYLIASGIKQKNVTDQLNLETFLGLGDITPMQTSYTQTAVDRKSEDDAKAKTDETEKSNEKSSETSNSSKELATPEKDEKEDDEVENK